MKSKEATHSNDEQLQERVGLNLHQLTERPHGPDLLTQRTRVHSVVRILDKQSAGGGRLTDVFEFGNF